MKKVINYMFSCWFLPLSLLAAWAPVSYDTSTYEVPTKLHFTHTRNSYYGSNLVIRGIDVMLALENLESGTNAWEWLSVNSNRIAYIDEANSFSLSQTFTTVAIDYVQSDVIPAVSNLYSSGSVDRPWRYSNINTAQISTIKGNVDVLPDAAELVWWLLSSNLYGVGISPGRTSLDGSVVAYGQNNPLYPGEVVITAVNDITLNGTLDLNTNYVINVGLLSSLDSSATGEKSFAFGLNAIASGDYSHAEGSSATASGEYSLAQGITATASGLASYARGVNVTASGITSHAEGSGTLASGITSHAEGTSTRAYGDYAHAEGATTIATGVYSHAEGFATTASGLASHAEGGATRASGNWSHAQGYSTIASGDWSFAGGKLAISSNNASYVWSDTNGASSSADNQYTVSAEGGIRLLAGDVEIEKNMSCATGTFGTVNVAGKVTAGASQFGALSVGDLNRIEQTSETSYLLLHSGNTSGGGGGPTANDSGAGIGLYSRGISAGALTGGIQYFTASNAASTHSWLLGGLSSGSEKMSLDTDGLDVVGDIDASGTVTLQMGQLIRWETDAANYLEFGGLSNTQALMRFVEGGVVSNTYFNMISE